MEWWQTTIVVVGGFLTIFNLVDKIINWIKEAKVLKYSGGFYTIKWTDSDGGTRVRESRLYASKEEAESARDSVKRNRA